MNIVQMTSILINPILAEYVLKEEEGIVVLILNSWSIVENTNIGVNHLIVTDEEDGWNVNSLLGIGSWDASLGWK